MDKDYLYIASCGSRPSKIGCTNHPRSRLNQLRESYSPSLCFWRVWYTPGIAFSLEYATIVRLDEYRIEPYRRRRNQVREWFELSPWVVEYHVVKMFEDILGKA